MATAAKRAIELTASASHCLSLCRLPTNLEPRWSWNRPKQACCPTPHTPLFNAFARQRRRLGGRKGGSDENDLGQVVRDEEGGMGGRGVCVRLR